MFAVLASNDATAGGAVQALDKVGLAKKVFVSGQDADLAALQRIVAGTQSMTIYKPVSVLAVRAAEAAVSLAKREAVNASSKVNNGKIDVPSILLEPIMVDRRKSGCDRHQGRFPLSRRRLSERKIEPSEVYYEQRINQST